MKSLKFLLVLFLLPLACDDQWEDHYDNSGGSEGLEVSPLNLIEFLESKPEFETFVSALKEENAEGKSLADELKADQFLTVWALDNDAMANLAVVLEETGITKQKLLSFHINNLSYGISKLKNGQRLISLNGKYIPLSIKSGVLMAANKPIVIEKSNNFCKNGVIHVVESIMKPDFSIYEYIQFLGDDYSIIRDTLFASNEIVFDRENSTPIGVDKTGNTIYDSVFVVKNELLDSAGVLSEFTQATMMLPSNDVMKACFEELGTLKAQFEEEFTREDTLKAINWIKRAIFFNYIVEDYHETQDIFGAFGNNFQWRTTIQLVEDEPVNLSNGKIFNLTYLHIPNNINLGRIKELVHYYEYLDQAQKDSLFDIQGGTVGIITGDQASFSSGQDCNPKAPTSADGFFYKYLEVKGSTTDDIKTSIEFTPLRRVFNDQGAVIGATPILVPPGEYNLYMGFRSKNHPFLNMYINGELAFEDVDVSLSTPWNYDRVEQAGGDPCPGTKWNKSGGKVGLVNIESQGLASFKVKIEYARSQSGSSSETLQLYHWCLIPTDNNY